MCVSVDVTRTMASNVLEALPGKHIDVKEVFTLLESQETQVTEGIKTLIQENLLSSKLYRCLVNKFIINE